MPFIQFSAYPIWLNLGIFAVLAVIIWFAGARLSGYADLIADRTGMGKAFIGLSCSREPPPCRKSVRP